MGAITLGAMMSFAAARDVSLALTISASPPAEALEAPAWPSFGFSPAVQRELAVAVYAGLRSALEPMATARVIIAMLLSSASSLVFVAALRLRWATLGSKVQVAQLLGTSALGAGVLRTLDGAQQLVISRATAEAMGKVLVREAVPNAEATAQLVLTTVSVASVGWTVAMVGLFVGLGSYFRSPRVQEALAAAER